MHASARKDDSTKESLFESLRTALVDAEHMTLSGECYQIFELVHYAKPTHVGANAEEHHNGKNNK